MRALVQRVARASVTVDGPEIGRIRSGLLVLLGVSRQDGEEEARYIADKTLNLRVFDDPEGRFDRSALDVGAELLVVSQFTLYASTRKGRRPSFTDAAPPERAELFRDSGLTVQTGRFQARMKVHLVNDGPVTIMLDSAHLQLPRRSR